MRKGVRTCTRRPNAGGGGGGGGGGGAATGGSVLMDKWCELWRLYRHGACSLGF